MDLREKLLTIQSKLIAPKNQYNSFGKYKYRSCEDILEGLKPLLVETKTLLVISDDVVQVGDRYYIKATATLHDCESDTSISNTAFAREEENKKGADSSQVTGATSSYARKYALNGLFCIDDTKDADATNTHGNDEPKKATDGQIATLKKVYTGDNLTKLLKANNITKIEDLSLEKASAIIKKLKEKENE